MFSTLTSSVHLSHNWILRCSLPLFVSHHSILSLPRDSLPPYIMSRQSYLVIISNFRGKLVWKKNHHHQVYYFQAIYMKDSTPLRTYDIRSITFLPSSEYSSALRTIRLISSSNSRPFSAVIVIFAALPVPLSSVDTCKIPFASTSNKTLIYGTPCETGGIPLSSNFI